MSHAGRVVPTLVGIVVVIAGFAKAASAQNQFGRASGLTIDAMIYVADSESNYRRNPEYKRGIRIASVSDGLVVAFIPDPEPDQDNAGTSAAEGVAVDNEGNVYGAEVGPRALRKHVKR